MPKKVQISFDVEVFEAGELGKEELALIEKARETCKNAYAPYSNFWVGAAILLENGEVITGTNQENAAYPSGLCAERTAIYWVGANYPNQKIKAIAVTAKKADTDNYLPVTPCGSCRQAVSEYENKQNEPIKIILEGKENRVYVVESIGDLLPLKFSGTSLDGN